jgi:uncharacterized protein
MSGGKGRGQSPSLLTPRPPHPALALPGFMSVLSDMDKYKFTYQDIHRTVRSLAERVTAAGYETDVIVAIGSGGFIPARMLRTFIDRPILTVGVAYYDKDNKPTKNPRKVQWIEEAERELKGRRILLVDEVDDSRATLEYCVRELMSHGLPPSQ